MEGRLARLSACLPARILHFWLAVTSKPSYCRHGCNMAAAAAAAGSCLYTPLYKESVVAVAAAAAGEVIRALTHTRHTRPPARLPACLPACPTPSVSPRLVPSTSLTTMLRTMTTAAKTPRPNEQVRSSKTTRAYCSPRCRPFSAEVLVSSRVPSCRFSSEVAHWGSFGPACFFVRSPAFSISF